MRSRMRGRTRARVRDRTRGRLPFRFVLLLVLLVAMAGTGLALVASGFGEHGRTSARAGTPTPAPDQHSAAPGSTESGVPTVPAASATHPTGRGLGFARVIPCYTVTARQLHRVLDAPMADLGQRAAGSSGFGLTGTQREDCYWFSTRADGPYVVLSAITTSQLRDRGLDLTARKYFDTIHPGPHAYLPDVGDAAYAFGPASVAVLVGDVYLDATVVSADGHPLADARQIARLLGRLELHRP